MTALSRSALDSAKICSAFASSRRRRSPSSSIPPTRSSRSARARSRKCRRCAARRCQFFRRAEHAHAHFLRAGRHRLSADVINISASASSLTKGETLKDTAQDSRGDSRRHHRPAPQLRGRAAISRRAAEGQRHQRRRRRARASHAGAARSLHDPRKAQARSPGCTSRSSATFSSAASRARISSRLFKLGARVTLVGPSTLVPRDFEQLGVTVTHDIDEVLPTVDVVNLLRIQHERQRKEYFPGLGEYTASSA